MARNLNVKIIGDARSYQRALHTVNSETSKTAKGFHALGTAAKVGLGVGLVGVGLATRSATKELLDMQKVAAQTNAVIKSTGGIANVTAKHVDALGNKFLNLSGIDDEAIKSGENMLLTFKNIRNEVGKGNNIFDQAALAVTNMDVAMTHGRSTGESLSKTAIRIGKALQDPVKGSTALARVGVVFTDVQKKVIKHLVDTGHAMDAQKIILRELNSEFGGSAKALGTTWSGQINIARETLRNWGADLINKLVPKVRGAVLAIKDFAGWIGKIATAPSLKVAFQITGAGLKDLGTQVKTSVQNAIGSVDWKPVGTQLAATIGSSIVFGANVLNKALDAMLQWTTSHASQIAEVGAVIAGNLVLTLTDPAFWIKHWQLALGIALVAFSGTIGKIAGRFGLVLAAKLGPEFSKGLASVASVLAIRLPRYLYDAIALGASGVVRGFAALWRDVTAPVAEGASRLTAAVARGLRLTVIVVAFRAGLEAMKSAWNAFESWIVGRALHTVLSIVEPFSHLPGRLGGWARDAKERINRQLDGVKKKVPIDVEVQVKMPPGARGPIYGPQGPAGSRGPTGDGIAGIGDGVVSAVRSSTRRYVQRNPSMFMPQLAAATGAASGLKPMVLDDLALGQSMGLSLSSGYRPGAITSTGNKSLHSVGQAIDMVGSPFAMANFAHAEAGRSGVAEVLYSPVGGWYPGVGWTRLSGQLRQDHFSHVHVGVRSGDGRVGVGDGIVPAPGGSVSRPGLGPTPAPTPLAGLRRRIRALRAEERQLKSKIATVDAQIRQIDKTKKKSKAQIARRKDLAAESSRLHARLKGVQAQLVSLNQRVQEVVQHDYSELPISLQLEAAQAALTETTADDATALAHAQSYLESQLRRPGITKAQRVQLLRALAGVRGDLANLGGDTGGGGGGDTGGAAPVDTADLEAQLAQANARASYSAESARLANAFVSTGVFGSSTPGVAGAGNTIIFNNLIPDADQIRRATEAIAGGAGDQAYRGTSVFATGY